MKDIKKIILEKIPAVLEAVKKVPLKRASAFIILSTGLIFSASAISKGFDSPSIKWTPEKIEVSLFRGISTTMSVTFTSSKDLENAKLELVPELTRFVSVEPSTLAQIIAGQNNSVNLVFSVPQQTAIGTYGGTLHLKSDKKTVPHTLKITLTVKEPTAEDIPSDITLPSEDRISEDSAIGQNYIKDEIIVKFKDGASETAIKQAVQDISGAFIGFLKNLEIYQIQVTVADFNELDQKIFQLEQKAIVDFAGRQVVTVPNL